MEKIVIEDKEKENAYKKIEEFASLADLYYRETIEEGKLFKSGKCKIEAIKKEDVKQYIKEFLSKIGELMQIELHSEIRMDEDVINVSIISDNSPILIGKEGKNLDALQTLLRQTIKNQTDMLIKINLDASDYKLKKQKRLEREIKNIAREVLKTRIDAKLDPMNAFDRRIVHSVISTYDNLETESLGEAPNRYVTIKYKEN
ncbi:MAG: KH domain-containing protein [Bacilli bacterium]|jgi:spoIIIJ-associated protein|nr:KH domain-containing protein [Bacilli bacterium]